MDTTPPESSSKDSGPRFDPADEQERAFSRRLLGIVILMVGPSVGLLLLGFYEAAEWFFLLSVGAGAAIVFIHERAELVEGSHLLSGGSMRSVVLSAGIVILLHQTWELVTRWLHSWFN